MNLRLRGLLGKLGQNEQTLPDSKAWKTFLHRIGQMLDEIEEEQFRLERSLRFYEMEIQALYQDLLTGRQHLQSLAERVDLPVILLEPGGQAVLLNSQATAMLGYTDADPEAEDLLRQLGISQLVQGSSLAELFAEGQTVQVQGPLQDRRGLRVHSRLEIHPVFRGSELLAAMVFLHPIGVWNDATKEDLQAVQLEERNS